MTHRRLVPLVAALFCSLLFFFSTAQAQYRASLQGTVVDSQGAVVPDAKVSLTNKETNQTLQTTTNASGVYVFNALPPSRYTLTAEKSGFKKKVLDSVQVIAEQANSVNIPIEVGQVTDTITVDASAAPLIDTETATVSGTVNTRDIQRLPSFGRDVFQLAQLAPGAFGDASQQAGGGSQQMPGADSGGSGATDGIFKTENAPQIVANGTQLNANDISIDGIGVTSVSWGGTAIVTPNEEAVKELKVVTNSYDAENGRYSGAHIQVISQNGTNQFHGSAFFKGDRPGLNAYQKWNGPGSNVAGTPQERGLQRDNGLFNQFGGSFGGPIIKNKLFGFFSYETLRNNSVITNNNWYQSSQFLTQAPSGSIASQLLTYPGEGVSSLAIISRSCADIGLIEGTNCNTIPGQGLDVGSPLTTPLGTPDPTFQNSGNPGVGNGLDGVADLVFANSVSPNTIRESQYNGRIDFTPTSKDLIAASMFRVPTKVTDFNGPVRQANLWHHTATNESETALWNHTFSPTILNELRMNAAGWRWNEISSNPQEPWGLPQENFDNTGTANPQYFGAPGPSVFDQWTYNVKDTLTKVHNSHMLKFGGEVTRLEFLDEAPWSARPQYYFHSLWDFLNDAPYQEVGNFDPRTGSPTLVRKDTRANIYGFFVQDDYKVKPNLTLNLGLRWEYFAPLHEKNGNLSTLVLGSGANALTGLSFRQGGDLYEASKNNWGPQVGFAWSPHRGASQASNGRLVIRGGFGIGFNNLEEAISLSGRDNPPLVSNFNLTGSNILYAVPGDVHAFNGYPANPNAKLTFDSNNVPVTGAPITVGGFPSHLPTAYTYHYSLDTQTDLGHDWVFTLGYQGSTSHHFTRQYNQNLIYAAQGIPLNPMVNGIDWYANDGNANFNALLGGLRHQFSHSFQVDAQYRWSKSMDEGSRPYFTDNYQWNPSFSWAPSDYDVAHAFKLWAVWSPTIFRGSHTWMEKVAGGWSVSGILNAHSGFPWTPVYDDFSNTCNLVYNNSGNLTPNTCSLRPSAYLGGAGTDYSTDNFKTAGNFPNGALSYFNLPAITPVTAPFPATGPLPQAPGIGRNSFRGPQYFDVDMTLSKAFGFPRIKGLGEGAKLELRANFFNIFNKLNLTPFQSIGFPNNLNNPATLVSTDGVTSNPEFGKAQSALGGRVIELQARFSF